MNTELLIKMFAAFVLTGLSAGLAAQPNQESVFNQFELASSVDDGVLDSMRGGFVTTEGIKLDLGFQRSTVVDGVTEIQNAFHIQNIDVQGRDLARTISTGDMANITSAMHSVIQNNLDNKTIQINTQLDLTVKSLDIVQLQNGLLNAESINGIRNVQVLR
jgi:hypothetical protein